MVLILLVASVPFGMYAICALWYVCTGQRGDCLELMEVILGALVR